VHRSFLDAPRGALGRGQHRYRSSLHEEQQRRTADEDDTEGKEERDERDRRGQQRGGDGGHAFAEVAGHQVRNVATEHQSHHQHAPDDGNSKRQLEHRFGDELNDDQRPVGRREERAPLECEFQTQTSQYTP
jgi:hypothetical protein